MAVVSHNSSRLLTSFFGVCGWGRILVPVNFRLAAAEVEYIVGHSGASVLMVDPETVSYTHLDVYKRQALALTPETTGIIGARQLELMDETAWLVNVARGPHVDADALVTALRAGSIAGAALDVTDPEPLPEGHPLFFAPGVLITPVSYTHLR